jgi:propanol-preferring alcohol dehydrogenase
VKEGTESASPALYRLWLLQALSGRLGDLCEEQKNTGYSVNGSFAEYVLADPNYIGHLPDCQLRRDRADSLRWRNRL